MHFTWKKVTAGLTGAQWYGEAVEPLRVDHAITGPEETFPIGDRKIKCFHTPGHSPGSVVCLVESEGKRVLFGQDIHGPLDPSLLSNKEDYVNSLKFLLSLKIDILCEGHFGVFTDQRKIREYIESFL